MLFGSESLNISERTLHDCSSHTEREKLVGKFKVKLGVLGDVGEGNLVRSEEALLHQTLLDLLELC